MCAPARARASGRAARERDAASGGCMGIMSPVGSGRRTLLRPESPRCRSASGGGGRSWRLDCISDGQIRRRGGPSGRRWSFPVSFLFWLSTLDNAMLPCGRCRATRQDSWCRCWCNYAETNPFFWEGNVLCGGAGATLRVIGAAGGALSLTEHRVLPLLFHARAFGQETR